MTRVARILFPPTAAFSLMISLLAIVLCVTPAYADVTPISPDTRVAECAYTGCQGSPAAVNACTGGSTDPGAVLYCSNTGNCTGCALDTDYSTGDTVCACSN